MNLDIKKAYLSPFSEEKWYIKLIFPVIMAAMTFICNPSMHIIPKQYFWFYILITLVPSIILYGFFIQFQHNEINDELPLLPSLKSNFAEFARYGVRSVIFTVFYMIIDIFLILLALILLKMSSGTVMSILICGIAVIAIIFVSIAANIAIGAYADKFQLGDAFEIKRIYKLMTKAKVEILIYIVMAVLISLLSGIICAILAITVIGMIFSPVVIAILQLTTLNLEAQVYKIAKSRLEGVNAICQE